MDIPHHAVDLSTQVVDAGTLNPESLKITACTSCPLQVFESLEDNLPQQSFEQLKTQLRGGSFSELWPQAV